jgi:ATP-dependent Zn protease
MPTGKLILLRKKNINGMLTNISIYIDDKQVELISNGEQKEFNLSPGPHTIKVQQMLKQGKITIDIKENQTINLEFRPTQWILFSFISPILAIILFYFFHVPKNSAWLVLISGILLILYYFTIGKNKYYLFRLKNNR